MEHAGRRLDLLLAARLPDHSRSYLQKLIKNGAVRCGDAVCTAQRSPVKTGDRITIEIEEAESSAPVGENIDLPVLYEDDSLLVINKPPGMVVHPGAGNHTGTVVNALLGRNPELAEELAMDESRPGIVHRLDKDTSGCLVIAKTPQAQFKLSRSFAEREVVKTYAALVRGIPASTGFVPGFRGHCICNGLAEHAQIGESECIRDDGAPAVGTKMDRH